MAPTAAEFKEQGNKAFQAMDYERAEALYTKAVQRDPTNPIYFTNRAFSRVKLQSWDGCIDDSLKALELRPDNMKAYYYLAMAQLALHHPNEALHSAKTAYELCIESESSSASSICNLVLLATKEKWEIQERERIRRHSALLAELEDVLRSSEALKLSGLDDRIQQKEITKSDAEEEEAEIRLEARQKMEELRSAFAIADPANLAPKQVPEYMIDSISFAFMIDPVITKSGQSYERATILEHLRNSNTDPLTRQPLRKEDLRPNLALKQACAEFLDRNGWAVDW